MNGETTLIPGITTASPVVMLLEQLLTHARAGQIGTLAVLAVGVRGGVMTPIPVVGGQVGDLYVGAGMLQDDIMKALKKPASPIVRPLGG